MKSHAQLVIVGAGIVGCSVAYHLARKGWTDVLVLDQGPLFETGGSTSHAPGLVFQTNAGKTMCELAQRSVQLYTSLALKGEPCYYPVGGIEVAYTAERLEDLKRRHGWATSWGLESRLLTPAQTKTHIPLLDESKIFGSYYVPTDGIAKAIRITEALGADAQARGVAFHGRTEVTSFEIADGRVQAVITPAGRIACEAALICAGIWGPKIAKLAGISIPLTPVQHQLARTTPLAELRGETREVVHPILRHQDKAMYFRQSFDSYMVGSYQHEPLLVDAEQIRRHEDSPVMPSVLEFTPKHFAGAWESAVELLPALHGADLTSKINGMFSFTPDGNPVLGETHVRGLWVAEAVWITHGGGVGQVMAEWLADTTPSLDLRECDLHRFEPHVHSRAYVRARGATQYDEVYDIIHPLQQMEQPRPLRVSPFYARQKELGAVFFEGRGWERPQWFATNEALLATADHRLPTTDQASDAEVSRRSSVVGRRSGWAARFWSPISAAEHLATRERIALYDMTPLTRVEVGGRGALAFLQQLTSNQLDRPAGSVVYTCMLDERGGIRSDVTVARLDERRFQVACNGPQDLAWMRLHLPDDGSVHIYETTPGTCCVGVWGPRARDLVQPLTDADLSNTAFPYFSARQIYIGEVPALALRVSYVGELGWEIYTSADYGLRLWDLLWDAGRPLGVVAGGRGAFDSLRLEKGYRLWGSDMYAEHNPYEAGLGFTVKLDKGNFLGREALLRIKERGLARKLCCMTLDDPQAVVMGKEPILDGERALGYVTSTNYGYSVGTFIVYGYLPLAYATPGAQVEIEYFGARHRATVVKDPLYDPQGSKLKS
jgi:dimethylglycine oxidase